MKVFIVYIHLLTTCIAVGSLLLMDFELLLKRGKALLEEEVKSLEKTAKLMVYALVVLWISGLCLVALGYLEKPETYLTNQKLWAKFSVVFVLTINGYFLHHFSFPKISSGLGMFELAKDEQMLLGLTGVVSTVSWLFASYLGIARHWNYTVQYSFVMTIYTSIIALGFIFMCQILHLQGQQMGKMLQSK